MKVNSLKLIIAFIEHGNNFFKVMPPGAISYGFFQSYARGIYDALKAMDEENTPFAKDLKQFINSSDVDSHHPIIKMFIKKEKDLRDRWIYTGFEER